MLAILPLIFYIEIFLITHGIKSRREVGVDWRESFLVGMILASVFLLTISELLSLVHGLSQLVLAITWTAFCLGTGIVGWRLCLIQDAVMDLRKRLEEWHPDRFEKWTLGVFFVFFVVFFVIAWITPVNNNDSLQYHMSRVAHWAQNNSLVHYPTAYPPQLFNSIFTETVLLHIYQLAGGDQGVNLVQCLFFGASLVGVVLCARELGIRRQGQLMAVLFAGMLPLAILEATTTQNDLVATFWNLGCAYFAIKAAKRGLSRTEILLVGVCVGLGFATKGTFNVFALPFLLWMLASLLRQTNFKRILPVGVLAVTLALLLNLGFLVRNIQTYQHPIASSEFLEYKRLKNYSPPALLVNIIQSAALQIRTPVAGLNSRMADGIIHFCEWLGQKNCKNVSGKEFSLPLLSNQEDTAGNPLQFVSAIIVLFIALLPSKVLGQRWLRIFSLASLAGLLLVMISIEWEIYATRYQITFLFLMAAVFGYFIEKISVKKLQYAIAALLVLGGLPFLLFSRTRPVIGMTPKVTLVDSIFVEKPANLMLVYQDVYNDSAIQVARVLMKSGCKEVGLKIDSMDPEYIFWELFDAKANGIRLEIINPDPYSAKYIDGLFQPCAVVCTICGEKTPIAELPYFFKDHGVTLFLEPKYNVDLP